MNNSISPNKFTAIIMIVLGVSLMFLMGIGYQSYVTNTAIEKHNARTTINAGLLHEINDTKHLNEKLLTNQNEQLDRMEKLLNDIKNNK